MITLIFRSRHHIGKVSSRRSKGASFQSRQNNKDKVFYILKKLFVFSSIIGSVFGLILGIYIYILSKDLPPVDSINTYIPSETTKIYSDDNVVLAELHQEENRILIPLEKVSPILKEAVVALEDTAFYKHHGINFKGIIRAAIRNIQAGRVVEGASTLTQQLARNLFLHKRRKFSRKLAEAVLAIQIERQYTKSEILEMYLNQVYWGHNAYGIESASQLYFGKNAENLTLAESTVLVGMLKGPELYSPFRNYERSKKRQKVVLNRMKRLKIITPEEMDLGYQEEFTLATRKKFKYKAPFFTSHIVKQLIEMYGEEATYTSGIKVYTTLDYKLQEKAANIVNKYVELGKKTYWIKGEKTEGLNVSQGSILSIEPSTGYIKVLQGGVNFKNNEFNRCTQAKRQPGSSFKPFVYLAALEKGFSPGTILDDAPVTFNTIEGPYSPLNYNLKYNGKLPMRKALEKSVNVIAIKINDLVGPASVVQKARLAGIQAPMKPVLSLPLGANEVTMLELVSSYGVFANQGRRVEPVSILRIEDRDGIVLYQHKLKEKKVIDRNLISTLVDMMKGIVKYGTGRNANLPRPVAGKTGTTSDYRDAWFVGFVPQLVTGVWVGNDDNSSMTNMTGGWFPALMWKEFMIEALRNVPAQDFPSPRGLVSRKVNWLTGNLANEFSPKDKVTVEKYWRGKEPTTSDRPSSFKQTDDSEEGEVLDFFNM